MARCIYSLCITFTFSSILQLFYWLRRRILSSCFYFSVLTLLMLMEIFLWLEIPALLIQTQNNIPTWDEALKGLMCTSVSALGLKESVDQWVYAFTKNCVMDESFLVNLVSFAKRRQNVKDFDTFIVFFTISRGLIDTKSWKFHLHNMISLIKLSATQLSAAYKGKTEY